MPTVKQTKKSMGPYMEKHGLKYNKMNLDSAVWGLGARTNAWRITGSKGKASTQKSAVDAILFPASKPHIIDDHLKFRTLYHRSGNPPYIVEHNSGSTGGTVEAFHAYHLSLGWAGLAYHFVVYKDGTIHQGRPLWAMGGHTYTWGNTIGVCAVGNYESSDKVMPAAQKAALKQLNLWLHKQFPAAKFKRHSDMPNNSTACPGRYFPFNDVTP